MNTRHMEIRLANYFDFRQKIIVPNISWGLNIHECDLLIISKSGYATEVEIKISKQDLIADAKKRHHHQSDKIKFLYFALPEKLESFINYIPKQAGIIIVEEKEIWRIDGYRKGVKILRKPQCNKTCRQLSDIEIAKVLRLGTMRIWTLKQRIEIIDQKLKKNK